MELSIKLAICVIITIVACFILYHGAEGIKNYCKYTDPKSKLITGIILVLVALALALVLMPCVLYFL